jgi:hypothetical protein
MGIIHEVMKIFRDFIKGDADERARLYEENKRLHTKISELEAKINEEREGD